MKIDAAISAPAAHKLHSHVARPIFNFFERLLTFFMLKINRSGLAFSPYAPTSSSTLHDHPGRQLFH